MKSSNDRCQEKPAARNWLEEALRRFNFLASMRERRQIRRICVEFLSLYRQVEIELPQASHTERYARVIERRSGAGPATVQRFMRRAEESFAAWPVDRPLNFRDIVQYIAVTDCLKTDIAIDGVRSRVLDTALEIVPTMIPAEL
jgi:hypothetical protein